MGAWIRHNESNIILMFPKNVVIDIPADYAVSLIDSHCATEDVPFMARGKDYHGTIKYLRQA